jgi:hypothetical protein
MIKCFVVEVGIDVQVLGTKNKVVAIGANDAIDFTILFKFGELPLGLKRSTLKTNLVGLHPFNHYI